MMRLRQAAGIHQLAGQHEEGHGQQREAVGAPDRFCAMIWVSKCRARSSGDAADDQREVAIGMPSAMAPAKAVPL
jgi:hypothetical protein